MSPLDFVVRHGLRRAQAGVPLRAVLQAYRSGHRRFWAIMCARIDRLADAPAAGMRTTMLLSDYCIDYTDLISVVLTDAYVAEEGSLATERARVARTVVEDLLRGKGPTRELERELCERVGLVDGKSVVVVVAIVAGESATGAEVTRRLRTVAAAGERRALATARIGVGLDAETLPELPGSYAEARVALELDGDFPPARHLREVDVQAYLAYTADNTARRLLPVLPAEVTSSPLADTLAAFAAASLNVKQCARQLEVHTNTIYYRLNRVQKLTELDPRRFGALVQLTIAMQAR